MNVTIRDYIKGDFYIIKEIDRETFNECTLSDFETDQTAMYSENKIYIAFSDNEPAGFVSILKAKTLHYDGFWIDLLAVKPKFRGNGISGKLLDKAMKYAKSKGADIITALVRENNSASNSSFEKNNFEKSTDFFSIYSKKL